MATIAAIRPPAPPCGDEREVFRVASWDVDAALSEARGEADLEA